MNSEIKKDARKFWIAAGATLAMAHAMGRKTSTAEGSDEEFAVRLTYCANQLREKYPNLSKREASDIMFETMKSWGRQFAPKKWWQFWKR
jgi:hypothetical protein